MRPRRVCPEKEALHFIASGKDKDIFQKKRVSREKGMFLFKNIQFYIHYPQVCTSFENKESQFCCYWKWQ